ncbi:type III PLP-dependent enzyme [Streptomyces albipurpureus]|uniref:Type III PLP-dependent enzyme n=1 Tax=Streptomyces albipurpureus TaxID=2897419 RepID=A0ABT0UR28_9ACTN|nr:type III PLP-dependent enzyme [Streptomyces sp. CWNU-1]MCM2389843.1 type III PLP-dependent enzyme [Streptomyces sp. CWNU-1]
MTATPAVRALVRDLPANALPAYLYDLDALGEHASAVRSALPPGVEMYYAAKANPEAPVLAALAPHLDGFEVSSGGELAHVRQTVPGLPLAFGGPGKTPAELELALRLGTERFHVESAHDVRMLAGIAARTVPGTRVAVLLRFNLAVGQDLLANSALAMGGRPTPFGIDPTEADDMVRAVTDDHPQLQLRGVHAHLASGLTAPQQLAVATAVVEWSARLMTRHGLRLSEVNVGGGMAVDYARPAERFDWSAFGKGLAALREEHQGLIVRMEPGRALTAYCGWYATEVLDVKRSHGEEFAVLRGGTHHLRTPATKGHDQPCEVLTTDDWPHPWPRPSAGEGPVTLVGQLCTPKDVLARKVPAAGLRAGDRVLFEMAGAYAWNISHHEFLMHPRPGFHFLGAAAGRARTLDH